MESEYWYLRIQHVTINWSIWLSTVYTCLFLEWSWLYIRRLKSVWLWRLCPWMRMGRGSLASAWGRRYVPPVKTWLEAYRTLACTSFIYRHTDTHSQPSLIFTHNTNHNHHGKAVVWYSEVSYPIFEWSLLTLDLHTTDVEGWPYCQVLRSADLWVCPLPLPGVRWRWWTLRQDWYVSIHS